MSCWVSECPKPSEYQISLTYVKIKEQTKLEGEYGVVFMIEVIKTLFE